MCLLPLSLTQPFSLWQKGHSEWWNVLQFRYQMSCLEYILKPPSMEVRKLLLWQSQRASEVWGMLWGWVYLHSCLCMHDSRCFIWLCCFSSLFYYGEENILFMHCIISTILCTGVEHELLKMWYSLFLTKCNVHHSFFLLNQQVTFPPLCDFKLCPWFNSVEEVE